MYRRRQYTTYRSFPRKYSNRSKGLEKALEHIRQAQIFSNRTAHTDFIVKNYLYSLSPTKLNVFLDKYEEIYGKERRQYLAETIPLWKSGKRKMSGEVAKRLFDLLPPYMPISEKLKIVGELWKSCCPKTYKEFTITKDTSAFEIHNKIICYLNDTVQKYLISEDLTNDFNWLAENDSIVYQELKNAFLQKEKEVISECTLQRIQVILQYLNNSNDYNSYVSQTLTIGRHEIILRSGSNKPMYKVESDKSPVGDFLYENCGCVFFIICVIFLFFLLSSKT